ncbi:MAG: PLP-dependent aminotransferase family protein [Acidobacteria bacterium]|nr:PLP-dependent aminotransferase family protein [Acidobacteriota bacterium]MCA1612194.1 PLP-dependent aminotransferase family protein [Acidobacteriota bacterium]
MNTRSTYAPEWTGRTGSVDADALAILLGDWASGPGTLAVRLSTALFRLLDREEIAAGARLPSERALATALAVSRTTVVAAYENLRQEERAESRQGSGTRVLPREGDSRGRGDRRADEPGRGMLNPVLRALTDEHAAGSVSFVAAHLPGAAEFLTDAFAKSRRQLAALSSHHGYMPLGLPALRAALARTLSERGLPTREDEILVTNGAQQAIALVTSLLLSAGDEVILEDPTYPGAIDLFASSRLRMTPVPPAGEPGAVERIAAALRRPRAKLLYLQPTFHNPTGAILPERQRREIARLAEQSGVAILEDHTLADLSLGAPTPPPIAAFARRGTVLTVASLSKLYWGGLRIGWVRAPEAILHRLGRRKAMEDLGSSLPGQMMAVQLLERTEAVGALRRRQVEERLDALVKGLTRRLPEWSWKRPAGGLTVWVKLPRGQGAEFAQVASRHGVSVLPGPVCSPTNSFADHLRLAFVPEPEEIREGIDRLARAWDKYAAGREAARGRVRVIV